MLVILSVIYLEFNLDGNGQVMENLIEVKDLVYLNDGRGTRIDVDTGKESALHLTLVSSVMTGIC